ncbi:MAG: NAD(P)-dependent oxidoreductase [Hyphomicrobiales bacterium]
MTGSVRAEGIVEGRLSKAEYDENFSDIHPPLSRHEAFVESERCYFCHDAPCQKACPTSIDIPLFIRQIANSNEIGAAETILNSNILGGMCARVCPTETLCEEACVREHSEGKPVKIGLLQRHATDALLNAGKQPFRRAELTGKKVAVIGGGPAGLACAHKLAEFGHSATIFEAKHVLGGLNEFGIAAYKATENFAKKEVDFVLSIGGIEPKTGQSLGVDFDIGQLRRDYNAVFVGTGLGAVNKLGLSGEDTLIGVVDAVDYISKLRQSKDLSKLPVGRHIVVIGGGMTAIDVAVQSKKLGAEHVTVVYRRGQDQMKASAYERHLAQMSGVTLLTWARPSELIGDQGKLTAVRFAETEEIAGKLVDKGGAFTLPADMVFTAIGQVFVADGVGGAQPLALSGGRIIVDQERKTSVSGVWAGGDCVAGGQDLTVSAVEDGKQAAFSIHRALSV